MPKRRRHRIARLPPPARKGPIKGLCPDVRARNPPNPNPKSGFRRHESRRRGAIDRNDGALPPTIGARRGEAEDVHEFAVARRVRRRAC